jgi:hypothetical protein
LPPFRKKNIGVDPGCQHHDFSNQVHPNASSGTKNHTEGGELTDDELEDPTPKYDIFGDESSEVCDDNNSTEQQTKFDSTTAA